MISEIYKTIHHCFPNSKVIPHEWTTNYVSSADFSNCECIVNGMTNIKLAPVHNLTSWSYYKDHYNVEKYASNEELLFLWISNSWKNTGWNCSNQRFRNLIIFTHIHHVLDIQNRIIVTECISIVYFVNNSEFMSSRISQSYLHIKENIHILQFNKNVFQFKTVHYHVLKYEFYFIKRKYLWKSNVQNR